jgi:hypothetical protein
MAYHGDRAGITHLLRDMIVNPADGLRQVAGHLFDGHLRHEPVICRDEVEALVNECSWSRLHLGLIAGSHGRPSW